MRILRQSRVLEVEDGETIAVIAKAPGPTVSDPADEYPYVAKGFRVVADRIGPTLVLVPLSNEPVKLSQIDTNGLFASEASKKLEEVKSIIDSFNTGELPPVPPCGGRALSNTTSGS